MSERPRKRRRPEWRQVTLGDRFTQRVRDSTSSLLSRNAETQPIKPIRYRNPIACTRKCVAVALHCASFSRLFLCDASARTAHGDRIRATRCPKPAARRGKPLYGVPASPTGRTVYIHDQVATSPVLKEHLSTGPGAVKVCQKVNAMNHDPGLECLVNAGGKRVFCVFP